jgi:hypothetical protein
MSSRCLRSDYELSADSAGLGFLFLGSDGVILTTSQVAPAASEIVATMKMTMPISPRTVAKAALE